MALEAHTEFAHANLTKPFTNPKITHANVKQKQNHMQNSNTGMHGKNICENMEQAPCGCLTDFLFPFSTS